MTTDSTPSRSWRDQVPVPARWWPLAVIAVLGLGLQLWLWWRSTWIYWDQAALFDLALDFANTGRLSGLGKSMSGGFQGPAGLLQLLVGAPLLLWPSARASSLLVVLLHLGAGVLLLITLRSIASRTFVIAFAAVYWLSPWRLYLGAFVWEPSYLFLPAAAHFWACTRLRSDPARAQLSLTAPSAILGLVIATAPQLHPSGVILFVLTLGLLAYRRIRLRPLALIAGFAVGLLPALPWMLTVARDFGQLGPGVIWSQLEWLPLSDGIKALAYWLRLPSADISRRLVETVFCGTAETGFGLFGGGWRCGLLWLLLAACNVATVLVVIANVRAFRPQERDPSSRWLFDYTVASLVTLVVVAAINPIRVQGWYTHVVLQAAAVPLALWIASELERPSPRLRRWRLLMAAFGAFFLVRIVVVVVLGFGHPMFVTPADPGMQRQMLPADLQPLLPQP